jgi:hypothetical protein
MAAVLLVAAALIRFGFGIAWKELVLAAIIVFAIQATTAVLMFWAVRHWRKTGDLRLGLLLGGLSCLLIVLTGTHYAVQWQLVGPQDTFSEAATFCVIIVAMILFFSLRRHRSSSPDR